MDSNYKTIKGAHIYRILMAMITNGTRIRSWQTLEKIT